MYDNIDALTYVTTHVTITRIVERLLCALPILCKYSICVSTDWNKILTNVVNIKSCHVFKASSDKHWIDNNFYDLRTCTQLMIVWLSFCASNLVIILLYKTVFTRTHTHQLVSCPDRFFSFCVGAEKKRVWWISNTFFVQPDLQLLEIVD